MERTSESSEDSFFRPITVLPVLSKVIEKLVGHQIVDYTIFN